MQDTELDPRQANGTRPEPPRVAFGTAKTQNIPIEWAAWILTAMRKAELSGGKPQHFSAWLAAAGREVQ